MNLNRLRINADQKMTRLKNMEGIVLFANY